MACGRARQFTLTVPKKDYDGTSGARFQYGGFLQMVISQKEVFLKSLDEK